MTVRQIIELKAFTFYNFAFEMMHLRIHRIHCKHEQNIENRPMINDFTKPYSS